MHTLNDISLKHKAESSCSVILYYGLSKRGFQSFEHIIVNFPKPSTFALERYWKKSKPLSTPPCGPAVHRTATIKPTLRLLHILLCMHGTCKREHHVSSYIIHGLSALPKIHTIGHVMRIGDVFSI